MPFKSQIHLVVDYPHPLVKFANVSMCEWTQYQLLSQLGTSKELFP